MGQMKFAKPGVLMIFGPDKKAVGAGAAEVAGVAVLAGVSIQGRCPDIAEACKGVDHSLHADLRKYLVGDGHRCFEAVQFSKVFDLRHRRLTWRARRTRPRACPRPRRGVARHLADDHDEQ